jgi:very-short-patch-repair endonuclease
MANKRAISKVDLAIGHLANRPYSVFTATDIRQAGIARSAISERVAAGTLFRLHQGVYSTVRPDLLRAEGRWLAAVLACGPGAVLSHTHAAALWEIRHQPSGPVHVTVPTTAGRAKRPGITLHRSSTLLPSHTTVRRSTPVTKPARTLRDLKPLLPVKDWERTRSRALDHHYDLGPLGDAAIPSFSVLEARLKALCRRHSMPSPRAQQQLGPHTVDFLWPDVRLVVEVDDYATHGRRETFESDRERDAWLQLRGYRVLRFTWRMLTERPREVAATLRTALKG